MSTNYPIVQLTNGASVFYARSYGWTPGVATSGTTDETVNFVPPPDLPAGTYTVTVAASGISSVPNPNNPITITAMPMYADSRWADTQQFPAGTSVTADPVTGAVGVIADASGSNGNCFGSIDAAIAAAEQAAANYSVPAQVVVNGNDGSGFGYFSGIDVSGSAPVTIFIQIGNVLVDSVNNTVNLGISAPANIVLDGHTLAVVNTDSKSSFDGSFTGSGRLVTENENFALNGTDSLGGGTIVGAGYLDVSGTITGGGGVEATAQGILQPMTSTALAGTTVTVNEDGGLSFGGLPAVTLGGLAGPGAIGLGADASTAVALTVGIDGADTQYGGLFIGSGSLQKVGFGKLSVSALNDNPAMGATVNGGLLTVDGTLAIANPYVLTVPVGGRFDGTGVSDANGNPAVNADILVSGMFGAGTATAPGQLGVLGLDMAPLNATPGIFSVRLNGTSPGTGDGSGYDKVVVFSSANIAGASLSLSTEGFDEFSPGTTFVLIQDQFRPIAGSFAGLPDQSVISAGGNYFRIGYNGSSVTLTAIGAPIATDPTTGRALIQVNDGSAQRSEVRSITVTFSTLVNFMGDPGAAFRLVHVNYSASVDNLIATVSTNSLGNSVVTLTLVTFDNGTFEVDPISISGNANSVPGPSLGDGRYTLMTGTYTSPTDTLGGGALELGLYRLFGDVDGSGTVDPQDLGAFRNAYNSTANGPTYVAFLDADNSGAIDAADLRQFDLRYNASVF
jgi:hypothetical protein